MIWIFFIRVGVLVVVIWFIRGELVGFVLFWLFDFFFFRKGRGGFRSSGGEGCCRVWGGGGEDWGVKLIFVFVVEVICWGFGICIVYLLGEIFWNCICFGLMV